MKHEKLCTSGTDVALYAGTHKLQAHSSLIGLQQDFSSLTVQPLAFAVMLSLPILLSQRLTNSQELVYFAALGRGFECLYVPRSTAAVERTVKL